MNGIGIDTVGLRVEGVGMPNVAPTARARGLGTADQEIVARWSLSLANGAGVTVMDRAAFLVASLPKVLHGSNVVAVTTTEAMTAVERLHDEVRQLVQVEDDAFDPRRLEVYRLDTVRDFTGVTNPSAHLLALGGMRQSSKFTVQTARNGTCQLQTLTVRHNGYAGTLYDKNTESSGLAPPGSLRFELRLKKDRLSSNWARDNGGHVLVLADLTDEKVRTLNEAGFNELNFGAAVIGKPDEVVRRARRT